MTISTKLLIGGASLAALIFLAGVAGSEWSKSRVSVLIEECKVEPPDTFGGLMVCDLPTLQLGRRSDLVGVQAEIVNADRNVSFYFELGTVLALVVLALSTVPFGWYFLLDRLREVRDALTGKHS